MRNWLLLLCALACCGAPQSWAQTAPKVSVARANAGALAAVKSDHYTSLRKWIVAGADNWNAFPKGGVPSQTPFLRAIRQNDAQSVRLLIERGARVNSSDQNGSTPLHTAAITNADQAAKILLKYGANVKSRDMYKRTPIHMVGLNNDDKVARLLIAAGADVNARETESKTVLHYVCGYNSSKVVALLLKSGANANAKDIYGMTPIYMINANQRQNKEQVAALLLLWGTDANNRDKDGQTPLFAAIKGSMLGVAKLLLQKGAKVNIRRKRDGATPLHYAASTAYGPQATELLVLLIENGADVNARNTLGETPLQYAAYVGLVKQAKALLEHGADIHAKDTSGHDALWWATERKADEVAALLRAEGAQ